MDFADYLFNNGVINKRQYDEVKKNSSTTNGEKIGNIIVRKHILPYKIVIQHLTTFVRA